MSFAYLTMDGLLKSLLCDNFLRDAVRIVARWLPGARQDDEPWLAALWTI
jgi:hypothetical protein